MIVYIIDIIKVYFSHSLDTYWWAPFLALLFLATVPCLIRYIVLRRSH